MPGVEPPVLPHQRVRVRPDLGQSQRPRVRVHEGEQPPHALTAGVGADGDTVEEQLALTRLDHHEPDHGLSVMTGTVST
ncbi:hypothetical protein GCM10010372_69430 [Streptomyces tauricus]|nr:hypothetical protein GCM10010372_69430 [Streptomyces tauricus]